MDSMTWLMMANIVVWVGIGLYLAFMGLRQRKLSQRLQHLEMLKND